MMKRTFALVLSLALLCSLGTVPVAAAELPSEDGQVVVSRRVEYLDNGYYIIETVYQSTAQSRGSTTSGSKSAQCYVGSTHIFTVTVSGEFTYNGSTASATSASGSFDAYVSDATLTSSNAYTSGASAIAQVSVRYQGVPLSKTVKLTCDKDGNLS